MLKDESEFNVKKSSGDGLQSYCKICDSAQYKNWYSRHREKKVNYATALTKQRRRELVQWHHALKTGQPCTDCKRFYNPWVMEYDHLELYKKTRNISKMISSNYPKKTILKEIEKCELVCSNCHRERTYKRYLFKNASLM